MRQLPLILLGLWFLFDLLAPRMNMEQVSVTIWRHGWEVRLFAGFLMLMLASHLMFKWPWGPAR